MGSGTRWVRFWGLVAASALAVATLAQPVAYALRTRCVQFPDGSSVHCDEFCFVYRDDGSYAGWIRS